jgi:hypothetical protein
LEILLTTTVPTEGATAVVTNVAGLIAAPVPVSQRASSTERAEELLEKFRVLLTSPLAEGVARIVEESFRLLPIIPAPVPGEPARYAAPVELEPARQSRSRSSSPV